jgi:hypothetical protein
MNKTGWLTLTVLILFAAVLDKSYQTYTTPSIPRAIMTVFYLAGLIISCRLCLQSRDPTS